MSSSTTPSFVRRFMSNPAAVIGAAVLGLIVLAAIFAPLIGRHDPTTGSGLMSAFRGPSGEHWLGTDGQGRDVFSRVVHGARIALLAGVQSVSIALALGVPIGLLIGYRGGRLDSIVMRVVEAVVAIPGVVLAMGLIAVLGAGIARSMIAVGFVFAMAVIRLTRASVIDQRGEVYVDAARAVGASDRRVMWRHLLPNVAPVIIVQATLLFAASIVFEAGLSLIGLGASSDQASWGVMLRAASQTMTRDFTQPLAPGAAIFITVLTINAVGDGLRDSFGRPATVGAFGQRLLRTASPTAITPEAAPAPDAVLSVRDLRVEFTAPDGTPLPVVDGVSLDVGPGEVVALVGESGSGKTMSALAVMGLVPTLGRVSATSVRLADQELTGLGFNEMRRYRGREMAMIFQEPSAALNPSFTIGDQLAEPLRVHLDLSKRASRARSIELLERVGIPRPADRLDDYPHQFSGGMAQRVMIAMALACSPRLLIADEPTTALDVTVQGQVLDLLADLRDEFGMAILLITHDLGVVADLADRAVVMYAGQAVEVGATHDLLAAPQHPYTQGLLAAMPRNEPRAGTLPTLAGVVPSAREWGSGCRFASRCAHVRDICRHAPVELRPANGRDTRCVRTDELQPVDAPDQREMA